MTVNELWEKYQNYVEENEDYPSITEFSAYVKLSVDIIQKVFKRWVTEGKIVKNGNKYVEPSFVKELPEKESAVKEIKKNSVNEDFILNDIVTVVGVVLITVSIHFTYEFNKLAMSKVWAFLLSFAVVMFMSMSFALKSYMKKPSSKIILVVLWILGISYSVFTAVSGQFNDFRKYVAIDNSTVIENENELIQEQLKDYLSKRESLLYIEEQYQQYTMNPDLKIENRNTWQLIEQRYKELREIEDKITELREKLMTNNTTDVVSNKTVYSWISSILKANDDTIEFLIILFPSIFIDLCSSVCISFTFGKKKFYN